LLAAITSLDAQGMVQVAGLSQDSYKFSAEAMRKAAQKALLPSISEMSARRSFLTRRA
jgi:hypothetical protein